MPKVADWPHKLRELLIASGTINPNPPPPPEPVRRVTVRLDDAARRMAALRIAQARKGVWDDGYEPDRPLLPGESRLRGE
jgi:hypothetical protein